MTPESHVFGQRIAVHYDASRALGDDSMRRLVEHLRVELAGRGRCLEIGVGTGQIALPLAAADIPLIGIDPSAPMLAVLRQKAGARPRVATLRADAVSLPFSDAAFGAGLMFRVLHLIPRWEDALHEVARVIRRPGVVVIQFTGGSSEGRQAPLREIRARFHAEAGAALEVVPGVDDPAEVDVALAGLGARPRHLPTVVARRTSTAARVIGLCELGINSSTAHLPAAVLSRAADATRAWASDRFGDPNLPIHDDYEVAWRAYDLA